MYKRILPLALLFSSAIYSQTAKDTLWVSTYDEITTKALASSFKVSKPVKNKAGFNEITTYNKETKMIEVKGIGSFDQQNAITYDGKVAYYNADGSVNFDMFFELGNATHITSVDPFTQEEYSLTYQNGYPYDGTMVQLYKNAYFYISIIEGNYQSYIYINKNKPNQKYTFSFDENNNLLEEYFFNEKGEVLYQANYEDGSIKNGTSIILDYDTFIPTTTSTYVDGVNTETASYFKSGAVKYKMTATATKSTSVFYDNKGTKIATYQADLGEYGTESNQEGSYIYYNEYTDNSDLPTSQSEYKKGVLVKETIFYEDGAPLAPKSIKYYSSAYTIEKIEYFNADGGKKGELTYDKEGYSPANGVLYDDDSITTYKNGIIIAKKAFYSTGEIFEESTEIASTYYDKKGTVIGKLQFKKGTYGNYEPFQGDFITLTNDAIGNKITYDKGQAVYSATYEAYPSYDSKPILREETFTPLNGTSRQVYYNREGKKNREELFTQLDYYYEKTILKVTYFDAKGKVTGVFDNVEKEGTQYTFFTNDAVQSMSTYSKGKLVYKKEYGNKHDMYSETIDPYLASEISYNKEGVFYDKEGNQIAKASYKDGQPYAGTTSTSDGYSTTITTYEKGVKEGLETLQSDYSEYISTKTYYKAGEMIKEETYSEDVLQSSNTYLEGEVLDTSNFYDEEGTLISSLKYQDGYAYEGDLIAYGYDNTVYTTYKGGALTHEKAIRNDSDTLVYEKKSLADGSIQHSVYQEDGVLLYQYGLYNYSLHGPCVYYENGKEKYRSMFKDGRLIEGTVALKTWADSYSYYNADETSYFVCTLQKNSMTIQRVSTETNKVIFELTSKLKKGTMEDNPIFQSSIDSSNLYPYHEGSSSY